MLPVDAAWSGKTKFRAPVRIAHLQQLQLLMRKLVPLQTDKPEYVMKRNNLQHATLCASVSAQHSMRASHGGSPAKPSSVPCTLCGGNSIQSCLLL